MCICNRTISIGCIFASMYLLLYFFSQETPLREASLRLRFVSLKLVVKLFRFCLFAFYGCIFALVASGEIGFVHIFSSLYNKISFCITVT